MLALPVWLYELWRFITPALNPKEKRYAIPFVLSSIVLFALGAFVAFLTLEPALQLPHRRRRRRRSRPLFTSDKYLTLVSLMIVAFGLSFEFPVVLVFLLIAGVITHRAAPARPPVGHRRHRHVRRGDHAEPGPVLAVLHGRADVRVLRGVDHHR